MTEPIYQPKSPSPTVTCAHCGAVIDRAQARPIISQAQAGEVVDMSRRHRCADRERCEARGPIAQTAEELRADLEAAQTVIESLKAERDELKAHAQALFGAADIATRGDLKQIERIKELEEELSRARHDREVALELAQQSQDEATRVAEKLDAARGAQAATATTIKEELERQARARLVREVEFVRAVRALALSPDKVDRRSAVINTLLSMTTSAMTAIEQDEVPRLTGNAEIREALRLIGRAICDIEADDESTPEIALLTQARRLLMPAAGIWIE